MRNDLVICIMQPLISSCGCVSKKGHDDEVDILKEDQVYNVALHILSNNLHIEILELI